MKRDYKDDQVKKNVRNFVQRLKLRRKLQN